MTRILDPQRDQMRLIAREPNGDYVDFKVFVSDAIFSSLAISILLPIPIEVNATNVPPVDTNSIWWRKDPLGLQSGKPYLYNGAAWIIATPALLKTKFNA